jgi:hypothetical protein
VPQFFLRQTAALLASSRPFVSRAHDKKSCDTTGFVQTVGQGVSLRRDRAALVGLDRLTDRGASRGRRWGLWHRECTAHPVSYSLVVLTMCRFVQGRPRDVPDLPGAVCHPVGQNTPFRTCPCRSAATSSPHSFLPWWLSPSERRASMPTGMRFAHGDA